MPSIVDRVVPAPVALIDSARYLTSVTLDKDSENKSEKFREIITKACRQYDGWKDLVYSTSQENVLIGGAFWVWLDDEDPFPQFFRCDQCFLPDGTKQYSKNVPAFSVKKPYLINEAVDFISVGREEADMAGWDVDAMVETINEAKPHNLGDGESNSREYEDVIRDGNLGSSLEEGAKIVETRHLFVTEPDTSKVTQYILDDRGEHKVLFQKDDRYEKMEECICLFTLQPGNGNFYGSKGIGKLIINMHIAIERTRNIFGDLINAAGRMIFQAPTNKTQDISVKMSHPFIIVSGDGEFNQKQITSNAKDYLEYDAKLTQIAQQIAGEYIPNDISGVTGDDKTATEARLDYATQAQQKTAFLSRFIAQFGNGMSTIQRKLCRVGNTHPAAVKVQQDLQEAGLTPEEIQELSGKPAAEVTQDLSQQKNQQVTAVAQLYTNNPMVDQKKLLKANITAMSTPELADQIILEDQEDQTVQTEAVRQQIMENAAIMGGESVPVSPRDRHDIHLQVLDKEMSSAAPEIEKKASQGSPDVPQLMDNYSQGLQHGSQHLQTWQQQGGNPEQIKQYQEKLTQGDQWLQKLAKGIQKQREDTVSQPPEATGTQMIAPEGQDSGDKNNAPQKLTALSNAIRAGIPITHDEINPVLAEMGLPPLKEVGTIVPHGSPSDPNVIPPDPNQELPQPQ